MNFEKALKMLKDGKCVKRDKMIGHIKLHRVNIFSTVPDHFMLETSDGIGELWIPTNADLFANDWKECEV